MLKRILLCIVFLILLGLVLAAAFIGPYYLRVNYVEANPTMGYYSGYYIYISPGARKFAEKGASITFLVQINNSGANIADPNILKMEAWWTGFEQHKIADELCVVLMVPAFRPMLDWPIYGHEQNGEEMTTKGKDLSRIDLQLIAMFNESRVKIDDDFYILTRERFLLQGFSTSGLFANRFAMLHPERVLAVIVGSPSGWPTAPVKNYKGKLLPYPAGIGDLETLTGKPFDSIRYNKMHQLFILGTNAIDFADGLGMEASLVDSLFEQDPQSRWLQLKALHDSIHADVKFILVADHDQKKLQSYSLEFFRGVLKEQPSIHDLNY